MTLCIAVRFSEDIHTGVVCCFDSQVGNEYESTDGVLKWSWIGSSACAMYAGPVVAAEELLSCYHSHLRSSTRLTIENYRDVLWEPMEAFQERAEQRNFCEASTVELLVSAYVDGDVKLMSLSSDGMRDCAFYGSVGTGSNSADAILQWRRLKGGLPLRDAVYYAYEAKRFGEVSPYVGEDTGIIVFQSGSLGMQTYFITPESMASLDFDFKRFGPQPFERNRTSLPQNLMVGPYGIRETISDTDQT